MANQHYSCKISQGRKGRQRSHEDNDDSGRKPSRFTDDRPSESRGSNFGDDEIGGTSFDPRPAQSQENQRNLRRK